MDEFDRCGKTTDALQCMVERGHESMHYDSVAGVFWIDSLTRGLPVVEWKFYDTFGGGRISVPIFKEENA